MLTSSDAAVAFPVPIVCAKAFWIAFVVLTKKESTAILDIP